MKFLLRLLSAFILIGSFSTSALADKPKILQLKDLRPGTKAIGFSVFKGVEPEPFDVVLSGLMDQTGNSFILARISGGPMDTPLEEVGAVSGMSGSPIFIDCTNLEDCTKRGTLVGALSYGPGSFIKGGPNVLLTPAEYMLVARVGGYVAAAEFSNRTSNKINVGGFRFNNLLLFPEINNLLAQESSLGKCSEPVNSEIKPGSMVTVFLAKGTIPVGGSGTVTWRDGDNIYIFGHQLFGTGVINYPFVHVAVADVIQTPVNAYKIPGCYLNTGGAMAIDGVFEMAGTIGKRSPSVPLKVELHINNGVAVLDEEVVPSPMARMIINKLPGVWAGQLVGDLTKRSIAHQVRIAVENEPEIFLKNIIPSGVEKKENGPQSSWEELFGDIDSVFENFEKNGVGYKVDGIKVHVDFIKDLKVWTKRVAFLSQNKAIPGETVYANVVLGETSSGAVQQISIPIKVPDDFMERIETGAPSNIMVLVQSGNKFTDKREPTRKTSLRGLIEQLNQEMNYETNVLYVQQIMPKPKVNDETDKANAKKSIKPAWKWMGVDEGDLKQFPDNGKNEVAMTLSPALIGFIDLNLNFSLQVQSKDLPIKDKKEIKKRKRFWIF